MHDAFPSAEGAHRGFPELKAGIEAQSAANPKRMTAGACNGTLQLMPITPAASNPAKVKNMVSADIILLDIYVALLRVSHTADSPHFFARDGFWALFARFLSTTMFLPPHKCGQ